MSRLRSFVYNQDGRTLIEYSLIATTVGIIIIWVVILLGGNFSDTFDYIAIFLWK
jgi:Flp pilus assembly pilin Flp